VPTLAQKGPLFCWEILFWEKARCFKRKVYLMTISFRFVQVTCSLVWLILISNLMIADVCDESNALVLLSTDRIDSAS
jgi:hypothetical protein